MSEYNHDRAKVLCPEAAAEVERLRDVLKEALETIDAQSDDLNYMQVLILSVLFVPRTVTLRAKPFDIKRPVVICVMPFNPS